MLLGKITFSKIINDFSSQIIYKNFTSWRKLPEIIPNEDINLASIVNIIFNETKSKNKWIKTEIIKKTNSK